jgi:tetratricopeptide (TPR) repeat protein
VSEPETPDLPETPDSEDERPTRRADELAPEAPETSAATAANAPEASAATAANAPEASAAPEAAPAPIAPEPEKTSPPEITSAPVAPPPPPPEPPKKRVVYDDDDEPEPQRKPEGGGWAERVLPIVAAIAIMAVTVWVVASGRQAPGLGLPATVADLQAVHADVSLHGAPVRGVVRASAHDAIETGADGRARLRLDDGAQIVIDRGTKLTLDAAGATLESGRIFVLGAPGARTEIDVGGAKALITNANAGIERRGGGAAKVYAANEELSIHEASGGDVALHAGFTATIDGGKAKTAPEKSFDDWTGGMAAPWSVSGPPRRAVGELWGRVGQTEASQQITMRSHEVRATIVGEVAKTQLVTTFFNAGSSPVTGDYRLAIPEGAIVSRFAIDRGGYAREGRLALAARDRSQIVPGEAVLEWAGEGWVRGTIPSIQSGATVKIIVEYTEWLSPRPKPGSSSLVVQYRYPMAADSAPPQIGDFYARVDASGSAPISMASGLGATVSGGIVELRRPDFRPTADLVVDVEIPAWRAPARLYLAPPAPDDDAGATILVRTDAPATGAGAPSGVTLALVVDTSQSLDPGLFDAERALVTAVVGGLGAQDRVIVLGADQTARAIGPDKIGPADDARKKAILAALGHVTTGGATDLGRALEAGADALPADAPAAMVVYVGDGWPTVGDTTSDQILARLARRPGGAPRLGAALIGPLVNRIGLAALVRGQGPLFEVRDATDAPHTAVALLAEALQPTVAGVELLLGPEVERVYPRGARALLAGSTVTAVGRVRGRVPETATLRYRDDKGVHEEERPIVAVEPLDEADVARRWASARIDEIAMRSGSRETAADVALRSGVLTPWTGFVESGSSTYIPSALGTRLLDLGAGPQGGFGAVFGTARAFGTLGATTQAQDFEGPDEGDDAFKAQVARAAAHLILNAAAEIRACRDSRAAVRPDVGDELFVSLQIDGRGASKDVRVQGGSGDDEQLDRCVQLVVEALAFPESDLSVMISVTQTLKLSPFRTSLRGRTCSSVSTLPLPARRGVWRERLVSGQPAHLAYLAAKQSCELPTWTDQRTFLELVLDVAKDGAQRVAIAQSLDDAGEPNAASLLRREALRRAGSPAELARVEQALLAGERLPVGAFRKQYTKATDDAGRLAVVRRFLVIAPHDARLRRTLLLLLEAMGKKDELIEQARIYRQDPFTDAVLLADIAAAIRRAGDELEARRAYGELSERAPEDPWARAFLGDRLRNERWFDDATLAYEALEELLPGDAGTGLRLALAHAGAGRLDVAQRMLARVAQTGGRSGDVEMGELAGFVAHALLAEARSRDGVSEADRERLLRTALSLPFPEDGAVLLVRGPAGSVPIDVTLLRGPKDAREERAAPLSSASIGLYAAQIGASDVDVALRLRRPEALPPAQPYKVRVDALVAGKPGAAPRIVTTDVDIPPTGKPIEIRWTDGGFVKG